MTPYRAVVEITDREMIFGHKTTGDCDVFAINIRDGNLITVMGNLYYLINSQSSIQDINKFDINFKIINCSRCNEFFLTIRDIRILDSLYRCSGKKAMYDYITNALHFEITEPSKDI